MIRSLIAAATLVLATAGTAVAAPSTVDLHLPEPTGSSPVGTTALHLVDADRPDPWVPDRPRELMVGLWYPTPVDVGRRARYVTPRESEIITAFYGYDSFVAPGALADVRTNARVGTPVTPGRHPLVVLSPGFSLPRTSLTAMAEDLASNGYVVAVIEHTYESVATTFPDGRVTECLACELADDRYDVVPRGRVLDTGFVLDRLLGDDGRRPAWRGSWTIDRDRIAMAGHSIGGNTAALAMGADRRIDAGVNMDGTFFAPAPDLDRPFMLFGAGNLHEPGGQDATWDRDWQRLHGDRYWLTVTGTGHFGFVDYPAFAAQVGVSDPGLPLDGERTVDIVREHLLAFVDRHLRGVPTNLLDGPSPRYPEVRHW